MRALKSLCLVFAIFALQAQTAFSRDALSTQLLEKSGAVESVKTFPDVLRAQIGELRAQGMVIDPEFASAWNIAAGQSFQASKLVPAMASTISDLLSETDIRQLIAFYDSPLGKRIVQYEIDGSRPDKQAEAVAFAQKLSTDPKKYAARVALYRQLDEAAGLVDLAVNLGIKMSIAVQSGMMASGKMPIQMTYEEIKAAIEQQRPAIRQQVSSSLYSIMTYTYRDLSEADMLAYVSFVKSSLGKKSTAAYIQAIDLALTEASRDFGRKVAEGLGRKPI